MHSPQQQDAWIRLARSFSNKKFWNIISKYQCPIHAIEEFGASYTYADLYTEKDLLLKNDCHYISYHSPDYPKLLKEIPNPPPLFYARGNLKLLSRDILAFIGARKCSLHAARFAGAATKQLSNKGWILISGMATGIDTSVHRHSLENGTIAALAGGLDQIYPKENTNLYYSILEHGGTIISENPLGAPTTPAAFHARNRVATGIAQATIVLEAARNSGTYSTARLACEYGREVFVVPGAPWDPLAAGSNSLIKNGATMILSVHDIELSPSSTTPVYTPPEEETEPISTYSLTEEKILTLLGCVPTDINDLIEELQCDSRELNTILSEMEIQGLIKRIHNNCVLAIHLHQNTSN